MLDQLEARRRPARAVCDLCGGELRAGWTVLAPAGYRRLVNGPLRTPRDDAGNATLRVCRSLAACNRRRRATRPY